MNTITVKVELSQEDRARLDIIAGKLSAIHDLLKENTHDCERCANSVATVVGGLVEQNHAPAPVEEPQTTDDTTPEEKPAEAQETDKAEPEQPAIDRADIQKKVVALSAAGHKDKVREIVLAYGNKKVSDIPEDKLNEVWQKLTALEG